MSSLTWRACGSTNAPILVYSVIPSDADHDLEVVCDTDDIAGTFDSFCTCGPNIEFGWQGETLAAARVTHRTQEEWHEIRAS